MGEELRYKMITIRSRTSVTQKMSPYIQVDARNKGRRKANMGIENGQPRKCK